MAAGQTGSDVDLDADELAAQAADHGGYEGRQHARDVGSDPLCGTYLAGPSPTRTRRVDYVRAGTRRLAGFSAGRLGANGRPSTAFTNSTTDRPSTESARVCMKGSPLLRAVMATR